MLANLKRLSLRQTYFLQKTFHSSSIMQGKVALVLSGCGVYDGSEIHEASACMVHLSREGADVSVFAPDIPQLHVINHCKGEPQEGASRNVLEESARIARGNISPLSSLKTDEFSAIVVPGGFGAAKNLCNFAVNGGDCNVNEDLSRALKEFHAQKKPIGLCCIAPVIAAKVIKGSEVTVGHSKDEDGKWPYAGTAEAIATMGAMHVEKDVTDVHVDKKNLVVTTPAYMCNTELHNVFDGIGKMIQTVVKLATK